MHLTPEEQAIGKENFYAAIGSPVTRRDFLKQGIAAGVVSGGGLGAMYFGYDKTLGSPLRVGIIGTGDEGNVLIGAINPNFLQVVAVADIRPYNIHRAFHGDHSTPTALKARSGLMTKYGWKSEDEARKNVKVYDHDYHDLLNDKDVEGVIIALPLHLHATVAIEAMLLGKDVLTEKLMGHSVRECKEMARMSDETGKLLVTGHQRHYSILYDNAVDTIRRGVIGDIHNIRAQWHRNNLPGNDSWQPALPDEEMAKLIAKYKAEIETIQGAKFDKLQARIAQLSESEFGQSKDRELDTVKKKLELLELQYKDHKVDAEKHKYESKVLGTNYQRSALEELIRWRLFERTGGGLMAELGSHQLDASGIFISGLRKDGEKALPLSVSAVGGRYLFPVDRECEDHVYCIYEFPGPEYDPVKAPDKKIGVTYSSINGNGFGGYGEVVMGTTGTLILDKEQEVMMFPNKAAPNTSATMTKISVKAGKGGGAMIDTTQSGGGEAAAVGKKAIEAGPVSRGYTEEMEHWAWCIRNRSPENKPRCHPKIALGDAVIALVTNMAMRRNTRIDFKPEWFDYHSDETPEGVKPDVSRYKAQA